MNIELEKEVPSGGIKLTSINDKTADLVVREFNKEHWQHQVWFNKIPPINPMEVRDLFIQRNYAGIRKLPVFNIILNDNELIGVCGYYDYEPEGNVSRGKLWTILDENYLSLSIDVINLVIDWGVNYSKLHKVIVELINDMTHFAKVFQRLGFEKEGEFAEAVFIKGKWRSVKVYSKVFKEDIETEDEKASITNEKIKEVRVFDDATFLKYLNKGR